MPPKKGSSKSAKQEEKKEEVKEIILPDGNRTYFVGGWSAVQTLQEAVTKISPGEHIVILSGSFDVDNYTLNVPLGSEIRGTVTSPTEEIVMKGTIRLNTLGGGGAQASNSIPPGDILSPNPASNVAKGVDSSSVPPTDTAALPSGEESNAQGSALPMVDPTTWSKGTLSRLTFLGSVIVERSHVLIDKCIFRENENLLIIHHYCACTIKESLFTMMTQSGIVCLPRSKPFISDNIIDGGGIIALDVVGVILQSSEGTVMNNQIRRVTTGIAIDGPSKTLVEKNTINAVTGTGIFITNRSCCVLKRNTVTDCQYYTLQVNGDKVKAEVLGNTFQGKVKIEKGSQPILRANTVTEHFYDMNDTHVVCLENVY